MKLNRRHLLKCAASASFLPVLPSFTTGALAAEDGFFDNPLLPEIYLGSKDAKIILTEYASMSCPFCKRFHEEVFPELKRKYIDTGKIRFTIREFAFDARASAAFLLARCSPPQNYYSMIDLLFQKQQEWRSSKNPAQTLFQISKEGGFTEETFNACLTNKELLAKLNAIKNRGQNKFGVRAVPTLFINGEKFDQDPTFENLSKAIDELLG